MEQHAEGTSAVSSETRRRLRLGVGVGWGWEHVWDRAFRSADGWSVSRERAESHRKAASSCDASPPVGGETISRARRTGGGVRYGFGWRSPVGEALPQHGTPVEPGRHPGSNWET